MSHITRGKLRVEIKDRGLLVEVLREFGEVITRNAVVYNYNNTQNTRADIVLRLKDGRQQIGFKYNNEKRRYEFVGDRYGVYRVIEEIEKRYVQKAVERALRMQGYTVREQKNGILVGVKV